MRIRSYNAARREVVGVAGMLLVPSTICFTGVTGLFEDGVTGKAIEERTVEGVESSLVVRDVDGVWMADLLLGLFKETGVRGNGMKNSLGVPLEAMIRGLDGDARVGEGGSGIADLGVLRDLGDFGDKETRRSVRADCFGACKTREGRSARGMVGTFVDLMWS